MPVWKNRNESDLGLQTGRIGQNDWSSIVSARVLERLEAKGLVESSLGDPTPERGGKAKRYFRITKTGLRQVQQTRRVLQKLWRAIPDPIPAPKGESA